MDGGHRLIRAFQERGNAGLDLLAASLSFLGDEPFYLLLIPVLYWGVSQRLALRLAVFFLLSAWSNAWLKALWDSPRPDPEFVAVAESAPGGGIPSGHAQHAVVTWGFFAWFATRPRGRSGAPPRGRWPMLWPWAVAALLAVGIGLSRIYRGVHFAVDVLVGWAFGALLLAGGLAVLPRLEGSLSRCSFRVRLAIALALPSLLLLAYREDLALPAASALAGFGSGAVVARRIGLEGTARGTGVGTAIRMAIGLLGLVLLWGFVRPPLAALAPAGEAVAYVLLGMWITFGAPVLFRATRALFG